MPSRAQLTTRGISATTVTTETLPKNAALTNNELDSNFINLRDQTFSIVGDDSTGINIKAGDTIKFTGSGGATVTATGSTVTITAGGALGNLQVNDTTLSPITTNSNIKLEAHGTGQIELISQQITLGDYPVGGTVDLTTASAHQLNISINNAVNSSRIEIIPSGGIFLNPNGSEKVIIDNNYWPNTDGTSGQTLITDGAGNLSWGNATAQGITFVGDDSTGTRISDGETVKIAGAGGITTAMSGDTLTISGSQGITFVGDDSTGTRISDNETVKIAGGTGITTAMSGDVLTITATGSASTGDLTITGTTISAGTTNADITITSSGTGNLNVNMDTMRIGDANTDATITTNGTGDLTLTTNAGTNSGTIQIDQGANQNIIILPHGSGKILLDSNYWPNADGTSGQVLTTDGAGNASWQTLAGELFELVGDDSTGTPIKLDDTFKIAGGTGIDTSVSGDTLTITNTGVPGPPGPSAVGITFVGDDSTGTLIADAETVKIAGTQNITTAMSGDTLTITGPDLTSYITANSTNTLTNKTINLSSNTLTGTLSQFNTALSDDNFVSLTGSETLTNKTLTSPIISSISNTGTLTLPTSTDTLVGRATTDTLTNKTLTTPVISSISNSGTITIPAGTDTLVGRATTDTLTNKTLTSPVIAQIVSVSNGNIELAPDGTGDVNLTADTVRIGDSNANATITTNGTGDLTISTNAGTNSNSIVIEDTATGRIQLIPNSTGRIDLGPVADGTATGLTNFPSAIGNNGVGPGDARIKGTGRFYSNLAYTPYTAVTSQELPSIDYTMLKTDGGSFDSANIRNSGASHFMLFDLNGGSATSTTTGSSATGVAGSTNQLFYMNNAGGTKTGLNIATNRNSTNIVAGHGGTLTIPRVLGYVNDLVFNRNTGETTTLTEAWAFRDQGLTYAGTGTTGTNSVITDYYAFETGLNAPSSTNTPWAFYVRTTSQNWRSRIGAVDLPRRWSTSATHSSGAAYTVNFQTAGHGFHQITLSSNITSFTMSNFPTSTAQITELDLVFIQDGTGGRTISFTPTSTEVFKFRNGTSSLSDSTAAPEILHAKVFTRYDGTKTIFYWDIDNREYV